jgi:predicted CxxxxCH...CXXCH cytochrome family protein
MVGEPIPCKTCHHITVTQAGSTSGVFVNGAWITEYDPVPLASHVMHVNGTPDVAFDNNFQYMYDPLLVDLTQASYDPNTKTCSNVGCHYNPTGPVTSLWQQKPKWGAPYDMMGWGSTECDVCHRMSLNETCIPAPTPTPQP